MYATTALAKNTKLTGHRVGTHQQLDQAAHKILARQLPADRYFPSSKEIIYFEGVRGPDGLKSKSPGEDEPSTLFDPPNGELLLRQILDHHHNLVVALRQSDQIRAAFEAAWLAHKLVDGLTPAHHFPLSEAKEELMSNKEFVKIFGEPIKGIMHGRSVLETARNNWLYWGPDGYMSKHIAYEYGVAIIVAALPKKALLPRVHRTEFRHVETQRVFQRALERIKPAEIYERFRHDGWTTELALDTRNRLLPELTRAVALAWYAAAEEAYQLDERKKYD